MHYVPPSRMHSSTTRNRCRRWPDLITDSAGSSCFLQPRPYVQQTQSSCTCKCASCTLDVTTSLSQNHGLCTPINPSNTLRFCFFFGDFQGFPRPPDSQRPATRLLCWPTGAVRPLCTTHSTENRIQYSVGNDDEFGKFPLRFRALQLPVTDAHPGGRHYVVDPAQESQGLACSTRLRTLRCYLYASPLGDKTPPSSSSLN